MATFKHTLSEAIRRLQRVGRGKFGGRLEAKKRHHIRIRISLKTRNKKNEKRLLRVKYKFNKVEY